MRAVVNPTATAPARRLGRRDRHGHRPALHRQRQSRVHTARACRTSPAPPPLSGASTFWTPTSAAPVEFSVANAGSLGVVKVARRSGAARREHRPLRPTRICGGGAPDVDPLDDRSSLRQPLRAAADRPERPHVARLRLRRGRHPGLDDRLQRGRQRRRRRRRRRAAATSSPRARLRRFAVGRAARDAEVVLVHRRPRLATSAARSTRTTSRSRRRRRAPTPPGQPFTLSGVKVDVTLPAVMLKGLYGNLLNYQSLPAGGVVDQPLRIWVAAPGHEHRRRALQTVLVEGRWTGALPSIRTASPGTGDESFPDVALSYTLPNSTWTPTGDGPVAFSVAAPGADPRAHARRLRPLRRRRRRVPDEPVRQRLRARRDGALRREHRLPRGRDRLRRHLDRALEPGPPEPDVRIPDAGRRRAPRRATGTTAARLAGRYSIVHQAGAPFAIVPPVRPRRGAAARRSRPSREGRAPLDDARRQDEQASASRCGCAERGLRRHGARSRPPVSKYQRRQDAQEVVTSTKAVEVLGRKAGSTERSTSR